MKITINIPTSLEEIKLKNFQKFVKVEKENPEAEDLLRLKMMQYFCGLKVPDIRTVKASDIDEITTDLYNLFNAKKKFINRFTFRGVEYGFIPNLEEMSFGEYIDLNTYITDADSYHKAMAVMFRPITLKRKDTYLIEEYETSDKYADIMREAPLSVFLGANVFFYHLGKELVKSTILSLENQAKTDSQLKKTLVESGVGTPQFMQYLEEMSPNLMMSLN